MQDTDQYLDPSKVTEIRLIHEECIMSEGDWAIDGYDGGYRYTEQLWGFDTEAEARAAIPAFCKELGIDPNTPVVKREY